MHIVIAPDSYKGSLSAKEVGLTIRAAILQEIPDAQIQVIPMADGGEGTLDTLLFATGGQKIETSATGPLGNKVKTCYGILGDGKTAVLEMAQVAGLPMVPEEKRDPLYTTTYGLGELILEAMEKGLRNFMVGLGGSATNDGGLGLLQALGASFLDNAGQSVQPVGASLGYISKVDFSSLHPKLKECQFKIACDVDNPLCGEKGASYIYGPQKGATPDQVLELDQGMHHFANLVEEALGEKWQNIPGAGAAGGLGFAFLALGGTMQPGAQIMAEATDLDNCIKTADWVFTGEGQSDEQTLFGKLPFFIATTAKKHGIPTILLSGALGKGHEQLLEHFFSAQAIASGPATLEQAMAQTKANLTFCARNVARLIKTSKE